jgi:hypothetical protein
MNIYYTYDARYVTPFAGNLTQRDRLGDCDEFKMVT